MSAPRLAGSSEATATATLNDSQTEQALISAKMALTGAPVFTFRKFKNLGTSISMFGNDGVFETPDESMLRSYPEALLRLYNTLTEEFASKYISLLRGLSKEHQIEYVVLKDLVSPLCGKCLVSKHGKPTEHLEKCLETENLQVSYLGMGNTSTWHGYLDAMAVLDDSPTAPIIVSESLSEELEVEEKDEDEGDQKPALRSYPSSGAGCGMEIKRSLLGDPKPGEPKSQGYIQNVNQAVKQSIVFSTIHHNRHEDHQSLVPAILLDGRSVIVVMYDCVSDILLVSQNKIEIVGDSGMSGSAIALLWMVLHHQAFLKERKKFKDTLKDASGRYCSGFQEACRRDGMERFYKGLLDYNQEKFTTPEFPVAVHQPFFVEMKRKRKLSDM
ncbi:uncharacterized protein [Oscarella lobularis]|uniref:uncharacterized protein isoform X2 n=1 Tax=Oscarella lobularis TaxID=121494 RepID=UPI003313A25F